MGGIFKKIFTALFLLQFISSQKKILASIKMP